MAAAGRAFGLELELERELPGLLGPAGAGRACRVELVEPDAIEAEWAPARDHAERIREDRFADGRLFMSVHLAPGAGYRIEAPGHGLHLVAADGSWIRSALPTGPAWRYQMLLFAQVLPLAATLRGLELLHSSAVSIGGRAVGLIAASGTGKSSVASHLVARGAELFTDDALALERSAEAVTAHPGPRFASVHAHELDAIPPAARARLGVEVGRDEKVYLEAPPVDGPAPLGALLFLSRAGDAPLEIGPLEDAARALLSSTFVAHVRTPKRLLTHLDLCADLAARVPCLSVKAPADARAGDVAEAILGHLGLR